MASQVHGYALNGRSRMMSIAIKTMVPHNAIAAALATPWTVREVAKNPGRKAAATPPASTMSINRTEATVPGDSRRETRRNNTTAAAVTAPTMLPLRRMCRNSDRSAVAGAVIGFL
jgi:hypothetical protein